MRVRGAGSSRRVVPGLLAVGGLVLTGLAGCAAVPEAVVVEAPAGRAASASQAPAAQPPAAARPSEAPPAATPAGAELGPVTETEAVALAASLTAALASDGHAEWVGHFAGSGLRQRQRDWFTAVAATPMTVREVHPLLLTPARPGREAELTVGFRHQVTGADLVPTVERYRYLLARADTGEVHVTGVDGGGRLDVDHPQLWDLLPTAVTVSEHLVLLHPADQPEAVTEAMPRLERAAAQVLADFPVPGVDRLVVTAAPTDVVDEVFGGDVQEVLGFATAVPAAPTVAEHDGMRVLPSDGQLVARAVVDLDYLGWEGWDDMSPADPRAGSPLLRHEGVHAVMLLREPGARPARWVSEGLAGWYEYAGDDHARSLAAEWRHSLALAHDPPAGLPPADPAAFHDADQDWHYALAASVFEYLEHHHGAAVTREVGAALHGASGRAGATDRVLQERLGTDRAGLEEGWLAWLAAQH